MKNPFSILSSSEKKKIKKKSFPDFVKPMLAVLTKNHFSSPDWIYERKLDGERCLAFKKGSKIKLMSRNKKNISKTYPELIELLEKQNHTFVADGEIVAFQGNTTSFSRLQNRLGLKDEKKIKETGIKVYFYLFDLIHLNGFDLSELPLIKRKELLKKSIKFDEPLRFTEHRNKEGKNFLGEACKKGWEGLIAKESESVYKHKRSKKWLKFKCGNQQEFVIGGFTEPKGSRINFGALLIGYYKKNKFKFAGKVGTGYSDETLRELGKKLKSIEIKNKPFDEKVKEKKVHWVKPKLVAEIAFTEWTNERKLRHPRYLGLRRDKKPKNVVREKPK